MTASASRAHGVRPPDHVTHRCGEGSIRRADGRQSASGLARTTHTPVDPCTGDTSSCPRRCRPADTPGYAGKLSSLRTAFSGSQPLFTFTAAAAPSLKFSLFLKSGDFVLIN
ncbi:hypothetical protein CDAR_543471 [Caerostris darwini]|uniref:Uncharacterized protein n=1 Tax=Caerostris darwini TaxID=1538125 RepID=A0AAV4P9S5_9ARAC|nr:hypothetical protein CDAR_543471 [Caerostris darwini]